LVLACETAALYFAIAAKSFPEFSAKPAAGSTTQKRYKALIHFLPLKIF
jgi:hypothetical protein